MVQKGLMIFLAGLLVIAFSAVVIAQEKEGGKAGAEPSKPAGEKAPKLSKEMTAVKKVMAGLKLTEDQQKQIEPILTDGDTRIKEAKGKDKIAARHAVYDEILGILNDEQKPQFEKKVNYHPKKKEEKKKEGGAPK
jgi:Spy/CpxP family protein refolding chaperone